MVEDAHPIFDAFQGVLSDGGYTGKVFVMGRSLGDVSAIELASEYPDQISGLILESAFASTPRLMSRLGFSQEYLGISDPGFPNLTKIRTITMPTLIIHGECDSLIPFEEGRTSTRMQLRSPSASWYPRWRSQHAADGGHGRVLQGDRGIGVGGLAAVLRASSRHSPQFHAKNSFPGAATCDLGKKGRELTLGLTHADTISLSIRISLILLLVVEGRWASLLK